MQLGATEISCILRGGCDPAGSQTPTRFEEEGGGRDLPPCQGTSRESLKPQRNVSAQSALDELQRRQGPGCLRSLQQDQAVRGGTGVALLEGQKGPWSNATVLPVLEHNYLYCKWDPCICCCFRR